MVLCPLNVGLLIPIRINGHAHSCLEDSCKMGLSREKRRSLDPICAEILCQRTGTHFFFVLSHPTLPMAMKLNAVWCYASWLDSTPNAPFVFPSTHVVCTCSGVKVAAISCNDVDAHNAWIKDIESTKWAKGNTVAYPIIADPDRTVATLYGMVRGPSTACACARDSDVYATWR